MIDNYLIAPLLIKPSGDNFKKSLIADTQISSVVHSLLCVFTMPLFLLGWAIRFSMLLDAVISKTLQGILHTVQKLFGTKKDHTDYLAPAVSILFSAIGKKKLNSKHMTDQALSVLLTSSNMISHAISSDFSEDKAPLMSDIDQHIPERVEVDKRIMHQQLFKATGSKAIATSFR